MTDPEHTHSISWVMEGPLWFCECGEEFYPVKATLSQPIVAYPRRPIRRIYLRSQQ